MGRRFFLMGYCVLLCAGCAPTLTVRTVTRIEADHSCSRRVVMEGQPHKRFQSMRVNLRNYLDLPDPELYDNFVATPDKVVLTGHFREPDKIPSDFQKTTPHTSLVARNQILFHTIDLGLVEVIEYEERIEDIVERGRGEESLEELTRVLLDAGLVAIRDIYGADYDTTRLESFARSHLPGAATRLYNALWELRRARRGGVGRLTERDEWTLRLNEEARRLGADLLPFNQPGAEKENARRLRDFINGKLRELVIPRRPDVAPLTWDSFSGQRAKMELLPALQASMTRQFGSVEAFMNRVGEILPKVFGAYLIGQVSVSPANPKMEFHARLILPGHVIQTNGIRDMDRDGSILWSFQETDVALSGYQMWARSLIVREDAVRAIGLEGFPGRIATVEKIYGELATEDGSPDIVLMAALQNCRDKKSLAPLRALAAVSPALVTDPPIGDRTVRSARSVLAVLEEFLPREEETESPPPAAPPPPEVLEPELMKGP